MTHSNKTVLVTGGAGFIGSELVLQLLKEETNVIVYDDFTFGQKSNLPEHNKLVITEGDLNDFVKLQGTISRYSPEIVYHLAAIHFIPYCNKHPQETIRANVEGTLSVLEACKNSSVKCVVYTSTAAVYGIKDIPHVENELPNPIDIYGASKLFGEHLVRIFHEETGIKCSIARLFNGFGRRETNPHVIPEILGQLAEGDQIKLGNLEPKRDYIHTSDIARAFRFMAENNSFDFDTFNVGTGQEISVKEIVDVIADILGRPLDVISESSRKRKVERYHLVPDISKIKDKIDWCSEMSLKDGFTDLLESVGLIKKGST